MDFSKWVENLLEENKNPTVKFDIKRTKIFSTEKSAKEDDEVEERITSLKSVLQSSRVHRRCMRNQLKWLPEECLAIMQKRYGPKTAFMGFQNKTGIYVYPEEAMFLLETNRAEISRTSIALNMDQAFSTVINSADALNRYKAYKKLLLKGLELKRNKDRINRDESKPAKKMKFDNLPEKCDNLIEVRSNLPDCPAASKEIFARLQAKGPKSNKDTVDRDSDYRMTQVCEGGKREFNLSFMFTKELDPQIGFYQGDDNIYCSVDNDVLFTKFTSVELPALV